MEKCRNPAEEVVIVVPLLVVGNGRSRKAGGRWEAWSGLDCSYS